MSRNLVVGAIGARTTPFKTVRIDEVALQRHDITMETFDLSDVFDRVNALKGSDRKVRAKAAKLKKYASWKGVPEDALGTLARLGVVIDEIMVECRPVGGQREQRQRCT